MTLICSVKKTEIVGRKEETHQKSKIEDSILLSLSMNRNVMPALLSSFSTVNHGLICQWRSGCNQTLILNGLAPDPVPVLDDVPQESVLGEVLYFYQQLIR